MNSPDSKRAHFYGHAAPTPPAPPLPPPPLTLSYAPLLVSARREGEAGRGKGGRAGGRKGRRTANEEELGARSEPSSKNESVVKVRQQCEVGSERPERVRLSTEPPRTNMRERCASPSSPEITTGGKSA